MPSHYPDPYAGSGPQAAPGAATYIYGYDGGGNPVLIDVGSDHVSSQDAETAGSDGCRDGKAPE